MPPVIIQDILVRLKANTRAFANQMKMPPVAMRKMYNAAGVMNKNFKKNITTGQRWALGIRKMTHGLRGFRMEMLGVMFFGMGLQKFFTGLLRPALEATGIFELFSAVLQLLFLPIVLALLPWIIEFATWLINLPEATKLAIGKFVIFGAILGGALFLIGMFALGIGSIILAFGGIIGIIVMVITSVAGLVISFLSMFGPIAAVAAVLGIFGIIAPAASAFGNEIEKQGGIWQRIKDTLSGVLGWMDDLWEKFLDKQTVQKFLSQLGIVGDKFEALKDPIKFFREKFAEEFEKIERIARVTWEFIKTFIHQKITNIKADFKEFMDNFSAENKQKIDDMVFVLKALGDALHFIAGSLRTIQTIGQLGSPYLLGSLAAKGLGLGVPSYQTGGVIPHTGLYKLHAGETVNQSGFSSSPTIIINASPGMDIDRLVSEVSDKISNDFESLTRR